MTRAKDHVAFDYRGHTVSLTRYPWGWEGVALGDAGRVARLKLIDYTAAERREAMREAIREHLGAGAR